MVVNGDERERSRHSRWAWPQPNDQYDDPSGVTHTAPGILRISSLRVLASKGSATFGMGGHDALTRVSPLLWTGYFIFCLSSV